MFQQKYLVVHLIFFLYFNEESNEFQNSRDYF